MARSLHCLHIIVTFLHLRHKILISFPHDNSQLSLVAAHIKKKQKTFQVAINSTASILQFHAQVFTSLGLYDRLYVPSWRFTKRCWNDWVCSKVHVYPQRLTGNKEICLCLHCRCLSNLHYRYADTGNARNVGSKLGQLIMALCR